MKINTMRKQVSVNYTSNNPQVYPFVISDLEQTIDGHTYLGGQLNCQCDLCKHKFMKRNQASDGNLFKTNSRQSSFWLKKILDGLCLSGALTLKFHVPDILFIEGDTLQIFQTNRKDGRLIKLTNSISLKSLYPTAVRLRKQYKNHLQQTFNAKMLQQIDPQFMHFKYFDKFVPSYFHDGQNNPILQQNKFQFKRYVLHKNKKFEIQQIEEHKMNDKQPFCLVKYTDGNCQLFNQREFEVYSLSLPSKLQDQLVYVQSYIKYKLEAEAIYYSEYTLGPNTIDHQVDTRAQKQTIILIGGGGPAKSNNETEKNIDTYDELCHQMMISQPREYVKLMTYKIVHYLSMTSRIYIDHIKIKWIMNDIGNIYLQQVMEFASSQIPKRLIKYRLPPKDEALEFYHQSHKFVQMYKELRRRKTVNTHIIKKMIDGKTYEEIMQMIDPNCKIDKRSSFDRQNLLKTTNKKSKNVKKHNNQNSVAPDIDSTKEKKVGFQPKNDPKHLKNNAKVHQRNKMRHNSVNLDKWRNIGLSFKKQRISENINSYFTIKIPDEQISNVNKTFQLSNKNKNAKSTGKCRLRYASKDDETTPQTYYNTISTFRSFRESNKTQTSRSNVGKRMSMDYS